MLDNLSTALPFANSINEQFDKMIDKPRNMNIVLDAPSACSAVNIVTREEWGAREPRPPSPQYIPLPTNMSFVHHTAGNWTCQTEDSCKEQMRSIQNFHMDDRGTTLHSTSQ